MGTEYVNTREACELLGKPLQYGAVHYLVRRGLLRRIEVSPRKMFYRRDHVEAIAAKLAKFEKREAA